SDDEISTKLDASPSGLTKEDVAFLRSRDPKSWKPNTPNSLSLPECKTKAVNFLASGAFKDDERYLPIICAAGSADSRISSVADDVLKRASVDLEDEAVVKSLFVAHNTLPAAHRIQILRLLSKSIIACTPKQQVLDAVKEDFALTTGEKPPIVGLEALRLHKALLGFLSWIARNSSEFRAADTEIGPALVMILKDYILRQGWPVANPRNNQSQTQDEQRLRANAYETIGTLARVSSLEYKAKDSLLKWLFDSLVSDPSPDIVVYVESALSSMMSLFKSTDTAQHRDLEVLLLEYMNSPEQQNVRTARHVAVRFANNCLPFNNIKARWISILALAASSSERRDVLEEGQRGLDPWWATKLHPEEKLQLPDWSKLSEYLFDSTPRQVEEHEMAIDQTSKYALYSNNRLQAFPIAIRFVKQVFLLTALGGSNVEIDWESQLERQIQNDLVVRRSIRDYVKAVNPNFVLRLLNAALDGLRDHPDVGGEDCIACLADILSFAPSETIISALSGRTHELLSLRSSNNQKVRQLVSRTFGILAPWDSRAPLEIAQLRELLSSTDEPPASLSAQYQCSLACLAGYISRVVLYGHLSPPEMSDHIYFINRRALLGLMGSDVGIQNAAMDSFAQLWTAGICWPSPEKELNTIIDRLTSLGEQGNEKLAIPDLNESSNNGETPAGKILQKLFEVHFAIARWDSDSVQLSIDIEPAGHGEDRVKNLRKRPEQLLDDCKATKPSLIKASGIWLFYIQSRLRNCQLVQETASRGLALSLKGDLVKDLVGSFTGTKTQLKVDEDTELFDAGALPTGDDIINLANEVGDQRLIYKFMALATNAATWTARSAFGRFGLNPKIYPKLYRYRFDPNPNAVVKDQTATIDENFDAIMTDLLKSILDGREWRVREASCAAIADLIYGLSYIKYEAYYVDIWRVTLRVLDDQKGSTLAMIAQGIENSVEEVKFMAISTVLDVPFIPTITTHALGLLSTVEPAQVNYYYQRLRSTAATRSPLFESVMSQLAPQLIGCSEVLSTLALRHSIFLAPYNAMLVKSLHTQILDPYAKSAAYLLRSASPETRTRYTTRLKIADAVLAIAKVSPDAFTDLESQLLPFAYFGKFDTDEYVSEHAGGDHTVKRYVDEIHGAAFTFSESTLQQIWPVLDKALSLKTFKGKEKVNDSTISTQTKKIAIREAKPLADYAAARDDIDMYAEVVAIVSEYLAPDELERRTTDAALKAAMIAYNRPRMRSTPASSAVHLLATRCVVLESQRTARAKTLLALATAWKKGVFEDMQQKLTQMKTLERSLDVQRLLDHVLQKLKD
ncbi:proteasome stabiliser-domain-containing protein, partial [Xylaria flabelliformis]